MAVFPKLAARAVLESLVLIDSCPAVFWQEAQSAHSLSYVSDERRRQGTAGREDVDKTFENGSWRSSELSAGSPWTNVLSAFSIFIF